MPWTKSRQIKLGLWQIKKTTEPSPAWFTRGANLVELNGYFEVSNQSAVDFDQYTFSKVYGRDPTLGEIGCTKAHLRAYEYLADSCLDAMIILESDAQMVVPIDNWTKVIPESFDINGSWVLVMEEPRAHFFHLAGRPKKRFKRIKAPYGTTAYVISRRAAIAVTKNNRNPKVYWQADWPPELMQHAKFYRLEPPIFKQSGRQSQINRPGSEKPKASKFLKRCTGTFLSNISLKEKISVFANIQLRELSAHVCATKKGKLGEQGFTHQP